MTNQAYFSVVPDTRLAWLVYYGPTINMVQFVDKSLDVKGKRNSENLETKRKCGFFRSKLVEFCRRTDLHGYKYIVMEELHIFERFVWSKYRTL